MMTIIQMMLNLSANNLKYVYQFEDHKFVAQLLEVKLFYTYQSQSDWIINQMFISTVKALHTIIQVHGSKISPRVEQFGNYFLKIISKFEQEYQPIQFFFTQWKYDIINPTASPLCSKSIATCNNKKVFRCYDCMKINTALLCYDCFVNSNHKGHTYLQFQAKGGCCDCGDTSLWNQNGFCHAHTSKNHKIDVPISLRDLFVREMGFVFYVYFWLVDRRLDYKDIFDAYGQKLFAFVNKIIELNFQSKILVAELMKSSLNSYPPLKNIKETILGTIFNLDSSLSVLSTVQKFAFEMYPLQSFRGCLLTEYFKLTKTNTFTWEHPIKSINFQYLTCIKTINQLIKGNIVMPLQLDPNNIPANSIRLTSIFKKCYEDYNYICKMKDSQEYFINHFELTNACHMAFYRIRSRIAMKEVVLVDEFYLKLLATLMEYIHSRKDLIAKSIMEVFSFILEFQEMTYSLAQERAFAILILTYLQGNLQKLNQYEIVEEIMSILQMNNEASFATPFKCGETFAHLIKKGLKNVIILTKQSLQPLKNSYEDYFFSAHPEKDFLLHLDLIYHKILMLLSKKYLNYWEIVEETLIEMIKIKEEQKQIDQSQKIISELSIFFTKFFSQDLNQISISNLIGYPNQQKITQLYLKILTSYSNKFTVKEIKLLSSYLVNNPEIFESTLKNYTIYQNGKLRLLAPIQPISKYIYMYNLRYFKNYDIVKWEQNQKINIISCLQDQPFFNHNIVFMMINNAQNIIKKLILNDKDTPNAKQAKINLERQVLALLQAYLIKQDPQIKNFFIVSIQNLKNFLHNEIADHINALCKERQELISEQEEGERQKLQEMRRKRQKIDLKRKQKEVMMRKNQEMMLKQYNAMQDERSQARQFCIYCKEELKQDYHLISYINLTNLITKYFIKSSNQPHLFFTTCGHKVHRECYASHGEKQQNINKCFLCKKKTNIIIPNACHNEHLDDYENQKIATNFWDTIYATMYAQNQEIIEPFQEYYNKYEEESMLRAILRSLVKEAIYYGLHDFQTFRRYSLPAYQLLYKILKMAKQQQIIANLSKLYQECSQKSHPLDQLEFDGYMLLKAELLKQFMSAEPIIYRSSMAGQLQTILSLIANPYMPIPLIHQISVINVESLLRRIPVSISELHDSMGECPFCEKLTNWLYYCIICDWKGCSKQGSSFHKHSKDDHLEGSVYILAANGKTSIICNGLVKNEDSVYENAYGETYTHTDQNSKKSCLSSFKLNNKKYQKFYQQILSHNLNNIV